MQGGDGFVDVLDSLLDVAQGGLGLQLVKDSRALTTWRRHGTRKCIDFLFYDCTSVLEVIKINTRSHLRLLLILFLLRSITLARTVDLFSMMW